MKKGDVSVGALVTIIGLLLALFVLTPVYKTFGEKLEEGATKRACQWNLLLNAIGRDPLSGLEFIPPDCKMVRVDVTNDQLEKANKPSKKEVKKSISILLIPLLIL